MTSVKTLKEKGMVISMEVDMTSELSVQCTACVQVKQHVEPFPKEASCNWKMIGDITFVDLWGPARTTAIGGYKYFITFTDGKSQYTNRIFYKRQNR